MIRENIGLKEKIKREIDTIPEEYLCQIEKYLQMVKKNTSHKDKKIKTLHLRSKFDSEDIRKLAYE